MWLAVAVTIIAFGAVSVLILESFTDTNQPPKPPPLIENAERERAKRRMSAFEVDPYYAERMEYLERTRRPAGLDFVLWETELSIKDWPGEERRAS